MRKIIDGWGSSVIWHCRMLSRGRLLLDCFARSVAVTYICWVVVGCGHRCSGAKRPISEIRYSFTTCNITGREGPTFGTCWKYYEDTQSPIARDNVLVGQEANSDSYEGFQVVVLPYSGVYNLTIAGASGGKGLCNPTRGKGIVQSFQMELASEDRLLIGVGRHGIDPCDSHPEYFLCDAESVSIDECSSTWKNLSRECNAMECIDGLTCCEYKHTGGGSGGGASFILFEKGVDPIAISGGGGGTAALLSHDFLTTLLNITSSDADSMMQHYEDFVNAKAIQYADNKNMSCDEGTPGHEGKVCGDGLRAGAGGGLRPGDTTREENGRSFLQQMDNADGGSSCWGSRCFCVTCEETSSCLELDVVGGFGGGGGGCGGGGGGGGYTGGSVLGSKNTIPGSGGFSYIISSVQNNVVDFSDRVDGYVDVVPADCGCAGNCTIYEDEDEFECLCAEEEEKHLAPDLSDCFQEGRLEVETEHSIYQHRDGYVLSSVRFNTAVSVLSININITAKQNSSNGAAACSVVFFGGRDGNSLVLVTNPVRDLQYQEELDFKLNQLSELTVNVNTQSVSTGEYVHFLNKSVTVTGATLISLDASCTIVEQTLEGNFSSRGTSAEPLSRSIISNFWQNLDENLVAAICLEALGDVTGKSDLIVPISVAVSVLVFLCLLVTVLASLLLGAYCSKRKSNYKTTTNPGFSISGMRDNPMYAKTAITVELTLSRESVPHEYQSMMFNSAPSPFQSLFNMAVPTHDFFRSRIPSNASVKEWEYPRNKLYYMRDLGEGQFGKVILMKADGIAGCTDLAPVAVKTLSSRQGKLLQKFRQEVDLMKKFSHPNIVTLLGVCPSNADESPLMILEFMSFGDLGNFLRNNVHRTSLNVSHFLSFACDVCKAMEFLSSLSYVHRDIAARNCLVGKDLVVKIADFGLAREIHNKDYYQMHEKGLLPVKWLAPESLLYGVFSTLSDVWSFGVLLWEIVSMGETPLPGLSTQEVINRAHNETLRHPEPPNCPPELFALMQQCHQHCADMRSKFPDLLSSLKKAKLLHPMTVQ